MTFIEKFIHNLVENAEKQSVIEVHGEELRPTTANQLLNMIAQVQAELRRSNIKKGDRVALLAPLSAKWIATDIGILNQGAIVVPLYNRQDPKEVSGMLADCEPSLLIVSDSELKKSIDACWTNPCPILLFEQMFDTPVENQVISAAVQADDTVTIVYTSGTSGEPKGVMLSASNIDFMLDRTAKTLEEATRRKTLNDRVFHFLPTCFLGSRLMMWTQFYRGNPIMISTDLKNLAQEMGAAKPNYFLTVPAVLERIRKGVGEKIAAKGGLGNLLYQRGQAAYQRQQVGTATWGDRVVSNLSNWIVFRKIKTKIGPNLEFIICGSAPLSEEVQHYYEMLGIPILQVYGLTETTGIISMDRWSTAKGGYVGVVIDGMEAKATPEGELICRGPNNFQGYWKKAEATHEMLRDGWIHTGDQAEFDSEGRIKILGRIKNVIVPSSGHNIAPEPLEQKLVETVPGAEHAFVVGHGRPYLSVLITGSTTESAVQKALDEFNSNMPHYKRIRKFKRVDDTFTIENGLLTANQKVRRRAIERHLQSTINSLYEGNA